MSVELVVVVRNSLAPPPVTANRWIIWSSTLGTTARWTIGLIFPVSTVVTSLLASSTNFCVVIVTTLSKPCPSLPKSITPSLFLWPGVQYVPGVANDDLYQGIFLRNATKEAWQDPWQVAGGEVWQTLEVFFPHNPSWCWKQNSCRCPALPLPWKSSHPPHQPDSWCEADHRATWREAQGPTASPPPRNWSPTPPPPLESTRPTGEQYEAAVSLA